MSGENSDLKTCSRCRCTILESFFSKNRKGDLFKTCDTCRGKRKKKNQEEEDYVKPCEWCEQKIHHYHLRKKPGASSRDVMRGLQFLMSGLHYDDVDDSSDDDSYMEEIISETSK